MVTNAPRWSEVLPENVGYIGSDPVVAHNAAFALPSYRLSFVTQACGFEMANHHDALADARAVIGIVDHLATAAGVSSLAELAEHHRVVIGRLGAGHYAKSGRRATPAVRS